MGLSFALLFLSTKSLFERWVSIGCAAGEKTRLGEDVCQVAVKCACTARTKDGIGVIDIRLGKVLD